MKTTVLGAGVVGIATAYFLAKHDHEVDPATPIYWAGLR